MHACLRTYMHAAMIHAYTMCAWYVDMHMYVCMYVCVATYIRIRTENYRIVKQHVMIVIGSKTESKSIGLIFSTFLYIAM